MACFRFLAGRCPAVVHIPAHIYRQNIHGIPVNQPVVCEREIYEIVDHMKSLQTGFSTFLEAYARHVYWLYVET